MVFTEGWFEEKGRRGLVLLWASASSSVKWEEKLYLPQKVGFHEIIHVKHLKTGTE